jgi:hypothetical protein
MAEFWEMTPRETFAVIDAMVWREQQQRRQGVIRAWLTARLTRAKRIPTLGQLLNQKPAKRLSGAALVKRRQEFENMTKHIDIEAITKARGDQ